MRGPWRSVARRAGALLLAGAIASCATPARALERARPVTQEYDLKAAFLFNFAQFVEWPKEAFLHADDPMVIGILGEDPFGRSLDEIVANESAHGRRLVVRRFRTPEDLGHCHILFVPRAEEAGLAQALTALGRRRVLTVGETKDFARSGMIGFELVQRRLRLHVNLENTEAAGLVVSSKLLRQAQVIRPAGRRP